MIPIADLKKQILFEDIPDEDIQGIASSLKELSFKEGDYLFKEGEETKGLYFVKSGKVNISKLTPAGWSQTLAVFGPAHFFGELSILERRRHEADALAIEKSELYLLSRDDFERLEKEGSRLAYQITRKIALVMSKNLRRMNEKFLNALISY